MMMKDCCKDAENLETIQARPDLKVSTCKICNCRHLELDADYIALQFEGK